MKQPFRKICHIITLKDLTEEIDCLKNDIDDLKKSTMKNQTLIEKIQKGIAELYDDLELES